MNGILIVAHGSRSCDSRNCGSRNCGSRSCDSRSVGSVSAVEDIANALRTRFSSTPIEIGYIEFSDNTVERGLQRLIDGGASNIRVVPCLLFEGKHVSEWLPREVERVCGGYPHVNATIAAVLGSDPRIVDIIADRITP